jgi:hypothetical protein
MRSLKLWHYALTVAIIVIAISLTVKHMFGNDSRWQNAQASNQKQMIVNQHATHLNRQNHVNEQ